MYSLEVGEIAARPTWIDSGWNLLYEQHTEMTMFKNILQHVFIYTGAGRSRLRLSEPGELVLATHGFLLELQECQEVTADCCAKLPISCGHQQVTQDQI